MKKKKINAFISFADRVKTLCGTLLKIITTATASFQLLIARPKDSESFNLTGVVTSTKMRRSSD